jgi:hypothetical protein
VIDRHANGHCRILELAKPSEKRSRRQPGYGDPCGPACICVTVSSTRTSYRARFSYVGTYFCCIAFSDLNTPSRLPASSSATVASTSSLLALPNQELELNRSSEPTIAAIPKLIRIARHPSTSRSQRRSWYSDANHAMGMPPQNAMMMIAKTLMKWLTSFRYSASLPNHRRIAKRPPLSD